MLLGHELFHADIKQMANKKKLFSLIEKVSELLAVVELRVSEEDATGGRAGLKAEYLEEEHNELTVTGPV